MNRTSAQANVQLVLRIAAALVFLAALLHAAVSGVDLVTLGFFLLAAGLI